jgi:hypothetical protein
MVFMTALQAFNLDFVRSRGYALATLALRPWLPYFAPSALRTDG